MDLAIQVETKVLPGSRIEVHSPELKEGKSATVFIVVHDEPEITKRPLSEVLATYKGGKMFKSAAEADEYMQAERDTWDN